MRKTRNDCDTCSTAYKTAGGISPSAVYIVAALMARFRFTAIRFILGTMVGTSIS